MAGASVGKEPHGEAAAAARRRHRDPEPDRRAEGTAPRAAPAGAAAAPAGLATVSPVHDGASPRPGPHRGVVVREITASAAAPSPACPSSPIRSSIESAGRGVLAFAGAQADRTPRAGGRARRDPWCPRARWRRRARPGCRSSLAREDTRCRPRGRRWRRGPAIAASCTLRSGSAARRKSAGRAPPTAAARAAYTRPHLRSAPAPPSGAAAAAERFEPCEREQACAPICQRWSGGPLGTGGREAPERRGRCRRGRRSRAERVHRGEGDGGTGRASREDGAAIGRRRRPAARRRSPRCARSTRPPWIRIGTSRSTASAKTASSRSSPTENFWARGWSLIPRAPRSRQRRLPRSASRRGRGARTG